MKKVAVFGAGRIGRIHATNLASFAGVKLQYICDANEEAALQLSQQLSAQTATADRIFADPSIDAVVICSPTSTHSDLIAQAAAAKKHIFCEKPIDLSLQRAKTIANLVADAGVACMLGFQRRFDPTFHDAKKRLSAGAIGNPEMMVITSRDPGAPPLDYIEHSGGIFRDMLIHDFDVFRWILCADNDQPVWLSAIGSVLTNSAIQSTGDFDSCAVTIRTQKGRICQINTSRRAAYGYDQRFEVLGSTGLLQCGNHAPSAVVHWNEGGITADKPEVFFLQRYAHAYRLEMAHFFECLHSGQPFHTTIDDGVQAQRLAEAATQSALSHQAVDLDEVD